MKKLIIIRGTSGIGKSTISKHLAEKLTIEKNLALIPFDLSMSDIIKQRSSFSQKTVNLMQQNTENLISNFLQNNFSVITEGIFYKKFKKENSLKRIIKIGKKYKAKILVFELHSDFKTILRRLKIRSKKEPFHDNNPKNAKTRFNLFEKNHYKNAVVINTINKTKEEIVNEIISYI